MPTASLDLASSTSLILTLLAHDDAQTARELAGATGLSAAEVRAALRQLVERGAVVTSGLAGGTRYVLAVDEPQHASRRCIRARAVIPATTDVLAALADTAEQLLAGVSLSELSARAARRALDERAERSVA